MSTTGIPPTPTPSPIPTNQVSNLQPVFLDKTEQQIHYESVTDYLKWAIGIAGGAITIIVAVALFVSWGSVKDMKDDYATTIKDLKEEIKDLKKDADKTVFDMTTDTKSNIDALKQEAKETVVATQDYTKNELERIEANTNDIALTETKTELAKIFGSNKIQDLIENEAVKEVKDKVQEIVFEQTKNLSRINDAASEMRIGRKQGMEKLRSHFLKPDNSLDSLTAINLYNQIIEDYVQVFNSRGTGTNPVHIKRLDDTIPTNMKPFIKSLVEEIQVSNDLNEISDDIYQLNWNSETKFKPFEIEEIMAWYKHFK